MNTVVEDWKFNRETRSINQNLTRWWKFNRKRRSINRNL